MSTAYEVYVYGNSEAFIGTFNAIASMMGSDSYVRAMEMATLIGAFSAMVWGLFGRGLVVPLQWILGINVITLVLFGPKADVMVVDRLSADEPQVVSNVPYILAQFAHDVTLLGDGLTRLTETAFQVIADPNSALPQSLSYQQNGVMFGSRLVADSRRAALQDPQIRTDFVSYVRDCLVPDFNAGAKNPDTFSKSSTVWTDMGATNPGRYTYVGNDLKTCPDAYDSLSPKIDDESAAAMSRVAMQLFPGLTQADANDRYTNSVGDATAKAGLAAAANSAGEYIRQNAVINMLNDAYSQISQQYNDPSSTMMATAEATIAAQTNMSWIMSGKFAESALPKFRGIAQALSYALFPFVVILGLAVPPQMFGKLFVGWLKFMVALELWPPLYAILNYFGTLSYAKAAVAAAAFGNGAGGLAIATAGSVYNTAISDQAIIGYISLSIPVIAWALVNQMQGIAQAFSAGVALQQAVHGTAGQMATGNMGMGNVSFDQHNLARHSTSPFMRIDQDEWGTTNHSSLTTGASAFQMMRNSSPLSGAMNQRHASELSTAAGRAMDAGKSETVAATSQAVATMSNLVSHGRDHVDTTALEHAWGKGEAGEFAQTHAYVRGMAHDLSRNWVIGEQDASNVIFRASAGLSLAGRASENETAGQTLSREVPVPGQEHAGGKGAWQPGAIRDQRQLSHSNAKGVSGGASGDVNAGLNSNYTASLQRAYDEAAGNIGREQADKVNRFAERLSHDDTARKSVAASDRDAEQATAQLAEARSHMTSADAFLRESDSLQQLSRKAATSDSSLGYDWAADPNNGHLVKTMVGQIRSAAAQAGPNPDAQMSAAQGVLRQHESLLSAPWSQPTAYMGGQKIMNEADLRAAHQQDAAAPNLVDDTASSHHQQVKDAAATRLDGDGSVNLRAPSVRGLQDKVGGGQHQIEGNVTGAYGIYDKAGVAARGRFENKAFDHKDQALKDRDGEFGSYKSTADKATGNAARDGVRSAENAVDAVKSSVTSAGNWLKRMFK